MPTYLCANCGNKIHSYWELTPSPNLLCKKCYTERYGDKRKTKAILYTRLGGRFQARCVVPGCPWKVKDKYGAGRGFNLHRIKSGREGGKYTPENCVLVCPHHHKTIEGLSREEIKGLHCTPEQIARMDKYHVADTLLDYEWEDIRAKLVEVCRNLGVPLKCNLYDLERAIKRELGLIECKMNSNKADLVQTCGVCGVQIGQEAELIFDDMPVCEYCAMQICDEEAI